MVCSPYFLPQHKTLSAYYQNLRKDLPDGGDPAWQGWQFPNLGALQVANLTRVMNFDTIIYAITGFSSGASAGAATTVNDWLQIWQIHQGNYLPFFLKSVPLVDATGSANPPAGQTRATPMPIKPALFVPAGDSIMVQVQNQDPTNPHTIEVVLFANRVPAGWQEQGGFSTLSGILRRRLGDAGNTASSGTSQPSQEPPNPIQGLVLAAKSDLTDSLQPPNVDAVGDEAPPGANPLVLGPTLVGYPAPGAAPVQLFSYTVPPGQRARIFEHALQHVGGSPPEVSGSGVVWSFAVNGAPLQGLGTQFAQIGAFATPARVVIWLTENDVFTVTVSIPSTGIAQPGTSGYRISGWTAPILSAGSQS